jgi:glycosyltransferase involved in cell wall biosynthesis
MNIAISKPDSGVAGGFEIVVQRLAHGLRARGHRVDLVHADATGGPVSHLPVPIDPSHLALFREFFQHLNTVARFEELDLSGYDVVLCTQPGSYAVPHPRKVVLFYHHVRSFYDLQEAVERVHERDIELHQLAAFIVRDVDGVFLTPALSILAGSRRVKQRLADHNRLVDNVEVFSAGIDEAFLNGGRTTTFESPLCVGRHEFPKRTELFLHAMNHVSGLQGRVIGAGSFTDRLKALDAWLRFQHLDGASIPSWDPAGCLIDDHRLWLHHAVHMPLEELHAARRALEARGERTPAVFLGRGSMDDLLREYASALCVVCPAFDEDYGLTCLEAMACGKPVIACTDGGGYVELIDHGVDGLLVEPNGPALGAAIEMLKDVSLARAMGERGREKARAYTWPRAIEQVERALAVVAARA